MLSTPFIAVPLGTNLPTIALIRPQTYMLGCNGDSTGRLHLMHRDRRLQAAEYHQALGAFRPRVQDQTYLSVIPYVLQKPLLARGNIGSGFKKAPTWTWRARPR